MRGLSFIVFVLLLTPLDLFGQDGTPTLDDLRLQRYNEETRKVLERPVIHPRLKLILSKEDQQKIQPSERDLLSHKEFLKTKNTGIFKLFQDRKCDIKVFNVNDLKCLEAIKIYGNGSYYSFSEKTYFPNYFTEIHFADGALSVYPITPLSFGMIKDLGNILLETVNKSSNEIESLISFKAPKEVKDIDANLFKAKATVKLNNTFAARFFHYPNSFSTKSKNNLYIFRIVALNEDESVTIVWKKINL